MAVALHRASARQMPARAPRYAITNARIVTAAGPAIDKGTVVHARRRHRGRRRGGDRAGRCAGRRRHRAERVSRPHRHGEHRAGRSRGPARRRPRAGGGGGGRGARRAPSRRPTPSPGRTRSARRGRASCTRTSTRPTLVELEGDDLRRLAAAGITSALAVPSQGIIRGQSALVNVTAPPDPAETSALADYRRGLVVVKSPVAQHVALRPAGRRRRWRRRLSGRAARHDRVRPAVVPRRAVAERRARVCRTPQGRARSAASSRRSTRWRRRSSGKIPVAFDASEEREILRALAFAKEFNLDPIIVGGAEAANVIEDLKAAKARVIVSANFQAVGGGAGGRGGGGGGGAAAAPTRRCASSACVRTPRRCRPRSRRPALPFAFTAGGLQNPADFVRNAGRTVKEGGLAEDAALQGADHQRRELAGAGDRLGTLEKGQDRQRRSSPRATCSTAPRIRHVFVAGRPVDLDIPAQGPGAGADAAASSASLFDRQPLVHGACRR